jgi:acetylornithine/succinyldiaminopimelate/putrescine aminotransferase
VLLEAIQGEGGVVVPAPGYLAAVRALCDAAGALLVVDEVQTGLGRTGNWFGFQADGVLPDIVTIAKALGNGMPIGACWARSGVAGSFRPGDHASTFGGQPLACSAAAATLDVMIAEDVPGRARRRGAQLAGGLAGLPGVAAVRGRGLLLGAVLEPVLELAGVISALLAAGVVVGSAGAGVLRLAPPLLVSEDEVDEALELIGQVLAAGIGAAG